MRYGEIVVDSDSKTNEVYVDVVVFKVIVFDQGSMSNVVELGR